MGLTPLTPTPDASPSRPCPPGGAEWAGPQAPEAPTWGHLLLLGRGGAGAGPQGWPRPPPCRAGVPPRHTPPRPPPCRAGAPPIHAPPRPAPPRPPPCCASAPPRPRPAPPRPKLQTRELPGEDPPQRLGTAPRGRSAAALAVSGPSTGLSAETHLSQRGDGERRDRRTGLTWVRWGRAGDA